MCLRSSNFKFKFIIFTGMALVLQAAPRKAVVLSCEQSSQQTLKGSATMQRLHFCTGIMESMDVVKHPSTRPAGCRAIGGGLGGERCTKDGQGKVDGGPAGAQGRLAPAQPEVPSRSRNRDRGKGRKQGRGKGKQWRGVSG